MNMAPSASDSYVFLPGGTTVRVELGSAQKEEPLDAYSLKASSSGGNISSVNYEIRIPIYFRIVQLFQIYQNK